MKDVLGLLMPAFVNQTRKMPTYHDDRYISSLKGSSFIRQHSLWDKNDDVTASVAIILGFRLIGISKCFRHSTTRAPHKRSLKSISSVELDLVSGERFL